MGFLMSQRGYAFHESADYVCDKRPVVCPNMGFIKQLQLYETMKYDLKGEDMMSIFYF